MKSVETFFKILKKNNPNPQTELRYQNHFELLIAVMLSAQATDKSVNLATPKLFQIAPDAFKMRLLGQEGIEPLIQSIGLYKTKAKHIWQTCEILCERFNGQVPQTFDELIALPGVGRKTANVVLNTAFGQNTIAVDTHIFRVANRTGLAPGKTVLEVEKGLLNRIPLFYLKNAHHWLILHGRYICKAKNPLCAQCVVEKYCSFENKNK